MTRGPIRLGAVGYLNARPLVFGLDRSPRFDVRYDVPSRCAALLHEGSIDLGLIPSIEYLRGGPYRIVPDLAIASCGPVASVALYTSRAMRDVRSIAMDTSSRTSVALVRVLCAKVYRIQPAIEARGADLGGMLARCDAALIIGDNALFLDPAVELPPLDDRGSTAAAVTAAPDVTGGARPDAIRAAAGRAAVHGGVEKIDLGAVWTGWTGLPFVYAFWAGRPDAVAIGDVAELQAARNEGVKRPDALARAYFPGEPARQEIGARYLRDNIKYGLGADERAGLERFYQYAAETGVVERAAAPRFFT